MYKLASKWVYMVGDGCVCVGDVLKSQQISVGMDHHQGVCNAFLLDTFQSY